MKIHLPLRRLVLASTLLLPLSSTLSLLHAQSGSPTSLDEGQNCISIMVGRLASGDGSVITSHTCDGKYRSWTYMEPAADHPRGAVHEVRRGTMKTSFHTDTTGVKVAGTIPWEGHDWAYLNSGYPCLNEKQLGIGETTFGGPDTLRSDNGLFTIEELERVALQRCTTAREAIIYMGNLARTYGYADAGECLTVADPQEVWQFEILGAGKGKSDAVWAARRIPDGEVGVSANIPRIGTLDRSDPANCLCSDNVEEVAHAYGLWDGMGEFVFWRAFNCAYGRGRNFRDREFYILSTLAPSLGLRDDMDELPFSVKPDESVDVRRVMELLRSTYDGTPYDICSNLKTRSGDISPVANPWMTNDWKETLNTLSPGAVPNRRLVAVAWCSYSTVIQLRSSLPDCVGGICWYAVDNPGQSPRIPIFCGNSTVPEPLWRCGQNNYWPDCALWTFRRANRLATLSWHANREHFLGEVKRLEDENFAGLDALEEACKSTTEPAKLLDAYSERAYRQAADAWGELESGYWLQYWKGF